MGNISKVALLIAYQESQGMDSHGAKGMKADAINYRNFLRTPYGGGWKNSEIILKLSPSKKELLYILSHFASEKDYAMIGFFGHGSYSEKEDDVMLQINPSEQIPSLSLRNKTPKSLITLDCCRAVPEEEIIVEALEHHFASCRKTLDTIGCRQLYEKLIEDADCGNTILYACSPYEKSFGSAAGGIYTRSLLNVAKNWENDLAMNAEYETPYCLSVVQAHNAASKETEKRQENQHPDIEKSRSGIYLPFAVALYKESYK